MSRTAHAAGLELPDAAAAPRRVSAWAAVAQAAVCYFMVTITMGWILGPVRDFWVRAGADPLFAILCQAVATLLVLVWAAGWVVSAFGVPDRIRARLAVGFGAMAALLVCDVLVGFLMFGLTPLDFAINFISATGAVVAVSFLFAAVMPALRSRGRAA
ncbi:MAG: hypothetical protein ACXWKR_02835 [Phenylobacterium sp.]